MAMNSLVGSLLESAKAYGHTKGRLLGLLAFVVFVWRFSAMARPPERDIEAIATMLGQSVGGTVKPDDFVWEGRGGVLHDALLGRRVLFLAARSTDPKLAPTNDLYRAEVRLTRAGRPIALRRVVNLTNTPRGHEHDLVAEGLRAAYATRVGSAIQTITVLDLGGDVSAWEARSRWERWQTALENWLQTGASEGIGRIETSFAAAPKTARFELTADALVMALGESAQAAAVSLSDTTVNPGPRDEHGIFAQRLPHPVTPSPRFFEQSLRTTFGPDRALAFRKLYSRANDAWIRMRESSASRPAEIPVATSTETTTADGEFPPPKLTLAAPRVLPGEGLWVPAAGASAVPGDSADAPLAFFETHVRPDPKQHPHSVVRLVVMDGRRLELRSIAGSLTPRSETGLHGDGRIPAADAASALAVFASDAPDGSQPAGVVTDQRAIVFPRQHAATLAVDRFGRPAIGPWPLDEDVPVTLRSVWQSSTPLVAEGKVVEAVAAQTDLRARSGLGVTNSGHVIYAYAEHVPVIILARALQMAGCREAMALSTSPDPVGFGFVERTGDQGKGKLLFGTNSFTPDRMWNGSPTSFVVVVARSGRPEVPLPDGATWEVDPGPQPDPVWRPAMHTATVTKLGAQVRLALLSPERFLFRVRAGTKEVSHRFAGTFPDALSADEQARALLAVGLGTGKRKGPRGMAIDGSIGLKFGTAAGVLVVEKERARIEKSDGFTPTADADAVELPLTADEGRPLPEARIVSSMRPRAALGVLDDGSVLIASTTFDTDEATTEALVDAGCSRVVALDRGSHQNAYVHRAGTETPPEAHYETTTLYIVRSSMHGRALVLR
jgi:hypothetical protein